MSEEIQRLKQDLAIMEQAVVGRPKFGLQHVGVGLGLGIGGLITCLLGLTTSLLETMPTRALMFPLFLGTPLLMGYVMGEKPFRMRSLLFPVTTKAESNTLAMIIGGLTIGFALLLKYLGVPYPIVPSVALMLSGIYLLPLGWGNPQYNYNRFIAVMFLLMAVTYPFVPRQYHTELLGGGIGIAGFGSAFMIWQQLRKQED